MIFTYIYICVCIDVYISVSMHTDIYISIYIYTVLRCQKPRAPLKPVAPQTVARNAASMEVPELPAMMAGAQGHPVAYRLGSPSGRIYIYIYIHIHIYIYIFDIFVHIYVYTCISLFIHS